MYDGVSQSNGMMRGTRRPRSGFVLGAVVGTMAA